jgi:hypothetical protein
MSIRLVIADPSAKTGKILKDLLVEQGVKVNEQGKGIVSYGCKLWVSSQPTLNAGAGMASKYQQLVNLGNAGVLTPQVYKGGPFEILFARKSEHKAGKDLKPVFDPQEVEWMKQGKKADYFVHFVHRKAEYRSWVFRGNHLGMYVKKMVRPEEYKGMGWNYKNGFAFELLKSHEIPSGAKDAAIKSIKALGLDFGAVDILLGQDGKFYVLEVNTGPGVEGPGRQVIKSLAAHIVAWEKAGYPSK